MECDGDHRLFSVSIDDEPGSIEPEDKLHIGTSKMQGRYTKLAELLLEGESISLTTNAGARILVKRKS